MDKLNVHIYVTPVCNIYCKHCYYGASKTVSPVNLLTIQQLYDIITELDTEYDSDFHIEGGELFLRKDMNQLFERLSEDTLKHITITTNGTLNLERHKNYLTKIGCLRISVCGHTDEMQEELRGIKLEPVLKNVRAAKKENLPLTLRMTLQKKNYGKLLTESLRYFKEKEDIKKFSLYEFQAVGRGEKLDNVFSLTEENFEKVLELLETLKDEAIQLRISLAGKRKNIVEKYKTRLNQWGYQVTYMSPEKSLTINYDGSVGICAWNVGKDTIGQYAGSMTDIIKGIDLHHTCEHCSAIAIAKNN